MKNYLLSLLAIPLLAGCLSSAPKAPTHWIIDYDGIDVKPTDGLITGEGIRVSNVHVSSPFDSQRLTVLRHDGTVAFDHYNSFASDPTVLLRDGVLDAVRSCGRCGSVVNAASSERCRYAIEVYVRTLALDCRKEGQRDATVELYVTILENRTAIATADGRAVVPAERDFSAAFTKAFSMAMRQAFATIHER